MDSAADRETTKHKHHEKHSVRFPEEQNDDCNKIHIMKLGNSETDVEIHAGFFKIDHKYEVIFEVPDNIGLGSEASVDMPPTVHIVLNSVQLNNPNIILTMEYFPTGGDGIVNETFFIKSKDGSKEIKCVFRAEVLGKDQGTPMLKDGVRCIHRPPSASSSS